MDLFRQFLGEAQALGKNLSCRRASAMHSSVPVAPLARAGLSSYGWGHGRIEIGLSTEHLKASMTFLSHDCHSRPENGHFGSAFQHPSFCGSTSTAAAAVALGSASQHSRSDTTQMIVEVLLSIPEK